MAKASTKQPMKPPFPVESISIDLIDLDLRNSRFPRDAQSQADALELMLTTAGNDCLDLLRDLTKTGQMNSSDIPIAMPRDGRYVMMEGNRRLTCLLLWHNPNILSQYEALEKRFLPRIQRLIDDSVYSPPITLRIAVAPSETEADIWIERKHTGGSGGAGTVEWGAAMKDRRRARNDPTKASRAMAFVDLLSREYEGEVDIQAALEEVRSKRYTMIQRFVDRSVVRKILGLKFSQGKMEFSYGPQATMPIIRQVLNDFSQSKAPSGRTWARELDTVEDFRIYLNKYSTLLPGGNSEAAADKGKDDQNTRGNREPYTNDQESKSIPSAKDPFQPKETDAKERATTEPTALPRQRPPRPAPTRDHIFVGLALNNFTHRIQEMVYQTSRLSVNRQNEVVSVMLRVILDMTSYQFLKSHGRDSIPNNLEARIKSSIKVIDPNASEALGLAEQTSPLRKAFHETTPDSIRLVQYAVHDIVSGRTPREVFTLADRYTPVLEKMNANMGSVPVK